MVIKVSGIKAVVLFFIAFLAMCKSYAQADYNDAEYPLVVSPPVQDGDYEGHVSEESYRKYYFVNCPADSNKGRFSMVTETEYLSDNSEMKAGKLTGKVVNMYNNKGQYTFGVRYDSAGVIDSIRLFYDKNHHLITATNYGRDLSGTQITRFKSLSYDKKGNITKDSALEYWEADGELSKALDVEYSWYDDSSNVIEYKSIQARESSDTDVVVGRYRYNANNLVVYHEQETSYDTVRNYYMYNQSGDIVFEASVRRHDSSYTTYKYDNKRNITERNKYSRGKLEYAYTRSMNAEGLVVETEEYLSTADAFSCSNNIMYVTVSDTMGKVYSVVTTRQKDGSPIVKTVTNKYEMAHGRTIVDSTFSDEEGFMYSEEMQSVIKYDYDYHGNTVLFSVEGGDKEMPNFIYKWMYNKRNNKVMEETYSSCDTMNLLRRDAYVYYKGGNRIKAVSVFSNDGSTITKTYDRNGRIEKKMIMYEASTKDPNNIVPASYLETIYEYKK